MGMESNAAVHLLEKLEQIFDNSGRITVNVAFTNTPPDKTPKPAPYRMIIRADDSDGDAASKILQVVSKAATDAGPFTMSLGNAPAGQDAPIPA